MDRHFKYIAAFLTSIFPVVSRNPSNDSSAVNVEGINDSEDALSLEIAIRLHDDEVRRRQNADTKAAVYLAFLAAIIPFIGSLKLNEVDNFGYIPVLFDAILFVFLFIYIAGAGWFSSRALASSSIVSIDVNDLSAALLKNKPRAAIAKDLIRATYLNYPLNNEKITYVNFSQKYIFRALIVLIIISGIDWVGGALTSIYKSGENYNSQAIVSVCAPFDITQAYTYLPHDNLLQFRNIEMKMLSYCM